MIKLCGMRREEDIAYANEFLPDFVGYILAEGFRRTVDTKYTAQDWESTLPHGYPETLTAA